MKKVPNNERIIHILEEGVFGFEKANLIKRTNKRLYKAQGILKNT